jgi:hypothetical protein
MTMLRTKRRDAKTMAAFATRFPPRIVLARAAATDGGDGEFEFSARVAWLEAVELCEFAALDPRERQSEASAAGGTAATTNRAAMRFPSSVRHHRSDPLFPGSTVHIRPS